MEKNDSAVPESYYVARWSQQERERLVIVDDAGNVVSACPVSQDCDRPGWEMLRSTGWCAYPGSEWEEEPPGHWEIAVFLESRLEETRGG